MFHKSSSLHPRAVEEEEEKEKGRGGGGRGGRRRARVNLNTPCSHTGRNVFSFSTPPLPPLLIQAPMNSRDDVTTPDHMT
uniref:Uncharacterized protein n=1 Tax=Bracon brevicornis TaxID=1563983 RepID=A0A6V7JEV0_9HYME